MFCLICAGNDKDINITRRFLMARLQGRTSVYLDDVNDKGKQPPLIINGYAIILDASQII